MIDEHVEREWDRPQGMCIRNSKLHKLNEKEARWILRLKAEDMVNIGFGVEVENLHYTIKNADALKKKKEE